MDLNLTTELDAVNTILGAVGEAPVVSLDGAFVDAERAHKLLTQRLRRVQQTGWTFNTDIDVVLTPQVSGYINVPANTLRMIQSDRNIVLRGQRVYDRSKQSYVFTDPITANLVSFITFEECPEAMRYYATVAACREFQDINETDATLHKFTERDEMGAWAGLLNYEAEVAGWNMLSSSALALRLKAR